MLDPDRLSYEFIAADRARLDEFIAAELPKVSLTRIRKLISDGDALVNGAPSVKGLRLTPGDIITVKIFAADKSSATPEHIPLEILFEDEHLLVVNKQTGLLAHPSNREKSGTLMNALAYHFWQTSGSAIRPGLVHRLDRDTSGAMVIAKTPRAMRTLSRHFRERWVSKRYTALVSGRIEQDQGEIDAPIGCDPKTWPHWRVMTDGPDAKPAKTLYRIKQRFASHTLLELEPLTGRTHQLRIHCNLIGHPILGDPIYASTVDPLVKELRIKHHLLHAGHLGFKHPATGQPMDFEAPLPQLIRGLLEKL